MSEEQPVRYRVSIVAPHALTGKIIPKIITFGIAQVGTKAQPYLFDATVGHEDLDCCIALQRLRSVVVEADEDIAQHKGDWQARLIDAALRGAFPKPPLR
jgi:hypothetical protein